MNTIQQHCCGADLFFDQKTSDKQYKKYLKKGPARVTKKIIAQLEKQYINEASLIDDWCSSVVVFRKRRRQNCRY